MGTIRSYEDLKVWQFAMDLAVEVYRLTADFPKHELYGLTAQLRRAAASVAANIAEGHGRGSTRDYIRFLSIARGSLMETRAFIQLAMRLGYLSGDGAASELGTLNEVSRMLTGLQQSLRRRLPQRVSPET